MSPLSASWHTTLHSCFEVVSPSTPTLVMSTSVLLSPISTSNPSTYYAVGLDIWSNFIGILMSGKTLEIVYIVLGILQNIAGGCGYPPIHFFLASVRTGLDYVKVSKNNVDVATKLTEHLRDIDALLETAGVEYSSGDMVVITNDLHSTIKNAREPLILIRKRGFIKAIFHSFTDSQTLEDQVRQIDNALQRFQVFTSALRGKETDACQTTLQEIRNIRASLQLPVNA
ncbi:hypothetical protein JB92DRAFT_2897381 [Gautieria morchelliformis]|nr:hypothetical protein JB92DRAFT_2897381 [Gautieria morchelliformis]